MIHTMIRMVKYLKLLLILLILFVGKSFAQQNIEFKPLLDYEGRSYFINGMNIAWNKFGGDFGRHPVWGAMYDPEAFEKIFSDCEAHGVNVVRLWIHCDGRSNPEFKNGFVTGWDTDFYLDLDDCFRRAKNHNVMIMPCMWSFDMCKDFRESAGPNAGAHADLLTDTLKMNSYIDKAFRPLVKHYKDQCNLFAWEVCNEPEWALDREAFGTINYTSDSAWTYRSKTLVPVESMQLLAAKMAVVVHQESNKMITIGSSAIRWNSDVSPSVGNWWSDASLQKQLPHSLAYLDFYQVHYYDYMHPSQSDPFSLDRDCKSWAYDKPVIIGECPASDERSNIYTTDEMIENAKTNGYAGVMFWSYNGDDGVGKWSDFKDALKKNFQKNPENLHMNNCPCKELDTENIHLKITENKVYWSDKDPDYTKYYAIEYSVDSTKKHLSKKVIRPQKEYSVKLKKKMKYVRFIHEDVYGYLRSSSWMEITASF